MLKPAKHLFKAILFMALFAVFNEYTLAKEIPSDNKIQGRLNIVNGASAECVMHHFYTQNGWTQIEGEIGRNGIDGLYYKKKGNTIREVLVAESKWNKSRLGRSGKNKAVRQMSQEWVLRTLDKLTNKLQTKHYSTIQRFIENDQYRARLFRLKPVSNNSIQITIHSIKNKGLKIFEEVQDTQLSPIDINKPKNSFERNIVDAYNGCRDTYLHKYLGVLGDAAISTLLKDNYIQKSDVKRMLNPNDITAVKTSFTTRNKNSTNKTINKVVPVSGQVWVNTNSHVYHCSGSRWYGNTKRGKYLDESTAVKSGNRPSKGSYCSSEGRNTNEKLTQSVSSSTEVWVNTKSHVYHCPGARWYGKTKHGRYMSESEAVRVGNRGARGQKCS